MPVHPHIGATLGADLGDSYYESTVYHALMRGALAYMGDEYIDTLVLGLPMKHFENSKRVATLESQYTGEIDLDGINKALSEYPECGIKRLKSVEDLSALNVLIVDPGEYTLDWLLMTPGGQAQRVSSAASDAGRHRILREVHAILEAKIDRPLGASFMKDIDLALRKKTLIRLSGRTFDLTTPEFVKAIETAVEDPVRQLFEGLRGADARIDLVAVLGGSPTEIADAIRRARPSLPVYCPEDAEGQTASLYANLRGFQEWSEAVDARNTNE